MEGLREDNEMSGKCTRARRLKLFTRKGRLGNGATRNCQPFHFRVVPRCAPTSGVPEISFFSVIYLGSLTELFNNFQLSLNTSSSEPLHSATITSNRLFFFRSIVFVFSNLVTSLPLRKKKKKKKRILHVNDKKDAFINSLFSQW